MAPPLANPTIRPKLIRRAGRLINQEGKTLADAAEILADEFGLERQPSASTVLNWARKDDTYESTEELVDEFLKEEKQTVKTRAIITQLNYQLAGARLKTMWGFTWDGFYNKEMTRVEVIDSWLKINAQWMKLHGLGSTKIAFENDDNPRIDPELTKLLASLPASEA